jgi:outer membrane protein TolC
MRSVVSSEGAAPRRARRFGVLFALVLSLIGERASAETVRLADVERHALAQRASIAAARARLLAARTRAGAARAPRYPLVTATLSGEMAPGSRLIRVRDIRGEEYLMTGSRALGDEGVLTPDFRHAGVLSLEGRLLDFGRTSASVRAADAGTAAAATEVRVEERAVALDVRLAYLAWLSAFEARRILARSATDTRALRESAEARVEEGSVRSVTAATTLLDETRARLELERGEAELARARLALELAAATRLPTGAEPDLALLELELPTPSEREDPETLALEQRRAALRAVAAGSHASARPVVSGTAEVGMRGQAATLFPLYRVGLAVVIPIFDGGATAAAAELAVAQANELLAHATDLRARAQAQRDQALVAKERGERQIELAEEMLRVADGIVRRVEEERALGETGKEQLIQARLGRSRAELDLLAVRVERARAILAVAPTPLPHRGRGPARGR